MTPTFKTTDPDAASAVYDDTSELPTPAHIGGGTVEFRFYSAEAPEAARKFRNDNKLQNFISAKKTVFRLIQQAKG